MRIFHSSVYRRNGKVIAVEEKREISAEEKAALEEQYKKTHPPDIERVSGCCDAPQETHE